ncbi:hypothetical protein VTO42DRAFT_6775 [Malbranchea cinnamomea]
MDSSSLMNGDNKAHKRGALIVIEGLDRAGKTTQCATLLQGLQDRGHNVKFIRFPDRSTPTGKLIDSYLRGNTHQDDHAIHLLFSANRWEAAGQIREDISKGITVIVDRYSYSGAVYSAAKNLDNLSLQWAWQPEIGLPRPDIWCFLNISQEEAAKRGGYGLERYENADLQQRVANLYLSFLGMNGNEEMRVIDASRSKDDVAKEVLEYALNCIANVDAIGPLRTLGPLPFASS